MQRRGGGGGGGNAGIVVSSDSGDGGGGNRRRPPPPTRSRRTLFPLLLFVSLSLLCVGAMLAHHLRRRSLSSAPSSSGARRKNLFDDASSAGDLRAMHVRKSKVGHVVDGRRGKKGSSFYGNERRYDDDDVGITSKKTNATLHLIFSTDCGSFQHWQSYLFFHSAYKVRQPGYITRIASGCTDDERKMELEWHDMHIRNVMSDRYRIHFTPHFSGVKDEATGEVKGDYKFFNKPYGLKHFLEHGELMGLDDVSNAADDAGGRMKRPDDVIILADPDFLLLRPLTDDFSDVTETLVGKRRTGVYRKMAETNGNVVSGGHPYAQAYGLGTQWRKFDLNAIAGIDSPAKDVSQSDGALYYPVGPPYVGIASDMYSISIAWSEFVPRVYAEYPHLLAEMYAYCIAAAHLNLPHTIIDSMMVSSVGSGEGGTGGEGWEYVLNVPAEEICDYGMHPNHDVRRMPNVVHYCQHYGVARYMFGKRRVPHDVFTCEHPPLLEPPIDLGSGKYPWIETKLGSKRVEMKAGKEKMEAFMVCALTRGVNDALAFFKENAKCDDDVGGGVGEDGKRAYDMWAGGETSSE